MNDHIDIIGIIRAFLDNNPSHMDDAGTLWFWNTTTLQWDAANDSTIINTIRTYSKGISENYFHNTRHKVITTIKDLSQLPEYTRPILPVYMIQCGTKYYNLRTQETTQATPAYFNTVVVPHELGTTTDTPVIDRLFTSWVGADHAITLKEISAYCLLRDMPIQTLFVFYGEGCNGKTTYSNFIERLLGSHNTCSSDLERLQNDKFEASVLYQKLACFIDETDDFEVNSMKIIKVLTGRQEIMIEEKYQKKFKARNYAKIFISMNNPPPINDQSDGAMRRLFSMDFPNQFTKEKNGKADILDTIPPQEYNNFVLYCVQTLPLLLDRRTFTNDMTTEERRHKYNTISNPTIEFISTMCNSATPSYGEDELKETASKLFAHYRQWAEKKGKKIIRFQEFKNHCAQAGFYMEKRYTNNGLQDCIIGLCYSPKTPEEENGEPLQSTQDTI